MRWNQKSLFTVLNNHLIDYPTPINFNYFYGFGVLAGIMLVIQILTGIFLAMHYTPHIDLAFLSVDHIMRDLKYGWLLRYMHSNVSVMHTDDYENSVQLITEIVRSLNDDSYQSLMW